MHINRLIILGGASCAGKSTLAARLKANELPSLREQLAFNPSDSWLELFPSQLPKLNLPAIERLFLHYDLYAHHSHQSYTNLSRLIENTEHVTTLTLWATPDVLLARARRRALSTLKLIAFPWRYGLLFRNLHPDWQRYQAYRHPKTIKNLYTQWFEFCQRHPTLPHWVLNTSDDHKMAALPLTEAHTIGISFSSRGV